MIDTDEAAALTGAINILYALPSGEFMDRRLTLSRSARDSGDPSTARAITALRRPTAAAAVVNRYVRAEPDVVERLVDVGARLRQAHEALDAVQLRELSTERRSLVAELTRNALEQFGPDSPSAALRDDVGNSFDAAVADPAIAARLGRLIRPEHWSGFGVAPADGPGLTLVQGGKAARKPLKPKADQRRSNRVLAKTRDTFDEAEQALLAAQQDEQTGAETVRTLSDQLTDLSNQLDEAKRQLDSTRRAVKSARVRRREARSALDRAERNAPTD